MIRIAIAGCGEHSRSSHAAPLARYAKDHPDQIELVAACDLDSEKAAEFCRSFGFGRPYGQLDEMLEREKPDACVCVMPMERIVNIGIQLLERGIPCVIEKPLGISISEAERLSSVAKQTQTPHMVSVNRRFMPFLNQASDWTKEAGPLRYLRAVQVRHNRFEPDFIWSTAIHAIDALRHLAGDIENFSVNVQQPSDDAAKWYVISLRFRNGAAGQVEISPTAGMVEESYELFGDGFRARVTAGAGIQRSLECWRDGQLAIESKASDDQPEDLRNGAYQEVEAFVGALLTNAHPKPTIEDVLPSARIGFAIADLVDA